MINKHPVFVYGTLMRGERAEAFLRNSEYVGKFLLKDCAMYHLGSYPGIRPCRGESVLGEVYYVDDKTLERMDAYEDNGNLYKRYRATVTAGDRSQRAYVYVYNHSVEGRPLMRQSWNAKPEDLVWYACYGSNLSAERFACYISGGTCKENGRTYRGASDPTPPRESRIKDYPGKLYFGNSSSTWDNGGVAFYDPAGESAEDRVHMRLYQITRAQLADVMAQEGASPNWYGKMLCLDVDEQGIPVYTLTSETRRPQNTPCRAYLQLIEDALCRELAMSRDQAKAYLGGCL